MKKSLYVIGHKSDVHLNGDTECLDYLATQIGHKDTLIKAKHSGFEILFTDGKLTEAYKYEEGILSPIKLREDEIGMPFPGFEPNMMCFIDPIESGQHQLGGNIPDGFHLPENNCVVNFQYLGFINNADVAFNWLPFKLHLTCPIFLNFEKLYLDYSDPLKPVIINREEMEQCDTSFEDELESNSEIIYEAERFRVLPNTTPNYSTNYTGIPNWIQYPDIPYCPKTGKRMRFLCQLHNGPLAKLINTNEENEWFEGMNFWGDGDLFVFFEPESKIVCYFIQST